MLPSQQLNLRDLRPLPCINFGDASGAPPAEMDGFVDDSAVFSLLLGPTIARPQLEKQSGLVLTADDLDFAGWYLTSALPAHATLPVIKERPAPPRMDEPGIGEPHRGSHRWWLVGAAGAFSTMLISLLLVSLSARNFSSEEEISLLRLSVPAKSTPGPPKENHGKLGELTGDMPVN